MTVVGWQYSIVVARQWGSDGMRMAWCELTWWLGITAISWHVETWCWLHGSDSDSGGMVVNLTHCSREDKNLT